MHLPSRPSRDSFYPDLIGNQEPGNAAASWFPYFLDSLLMPGIVGAAFYRYLPLLLLLHKLARRRRGWCVRVSAETPAKGNNMAQAIMDPEKVRRFADELQRFNTDLENRLVLLHARFAALGDTWQDQEHEKFSEEFKQAMKALKKFVEISREHTPYLLRKAQRIEEYLNQR
jgi:uncharacterized protein YukE